MLKRSRVVFVAVGTFVISALITGFIDINNIISTPNYAATGAMLLLWLGTAILFALIVVIKEKFF